MLELIFKRYKLFYRGKKMSFKEEKEEKEILDKEYTKINNRIYEKYKEYHEQGVVFDFAPGENEERRKLEKYYNSKLDDLYEKYKDEI